MLYVPDPEKVQRLAELAAHEVDAQLVPIHIKENYEPQANCGKILGVTDRWESSGHWKFATCPSCIEEDLQRSQMDIILDYRRGCGSRVRRP